ncbi:MAG: hypothetical protein H7Y41_02450, partial [Hyphomonadaceae bacterium]|nr:hypothetical protein [Clostridia bacterium]
MKQALLFLTGQFLISIPCLCQINTVTSDFENNLIEPYFVEASGGNTITVETPFFGARSGTKAVKILWSEEFYNGER